MSGPGKANVPGAEMPLMQDLAVVIVSWNVKALLRQCLLSLSASTASSSPSCQIIVVDNASTDGSVDMVRGDFPGVTLIANPSNSGFVQGCNQGAAASNSRYILLLNPDTEVIGDALPLMVDYMDGHPAVGVLGPRLLFPDGQVQSSRRRFPTVATAFFESTVLQQWFPRHRLLSRYYMLDTSDDATQEVDWVTGACMCIRREAWDQVGPLDTDLFMYSEELDWCCRAKQAGWRAVYYPEAAVVHHEGQSSGQVVAARHVYFQSSKVHYFRKHHGAFWSEALRIFLLATYGYQLVIEAAKWLVGHKRALRRERIAAYRQVLSSGLRVRAEAQS